jgi:GNAT superfamily N-acetyltransferase
VPDIPRLVETRAMLLRGRCLVRGRAGLGYVIVDLDQALAAVLGRPPLELLAETLTGTEAEDLLVEESGAEHVARALPLWRAEGAVIHDRPGGELAAVPGVRLLLPEEPLGHLPEALRDEVEDGRAAGAVAVACADGLPVSFCYAGSETETLWDVSIDTLEPYRRRGLARASFLYMARLEAARGRQPVWGALDSNLASLGLAARLGFRPVDRLVVFTPPPSLDSPPPP